jgi:hypothetical protein
MLSSNVSALKPMKIKTLFAGLFVTLALATQARANDNATTTAPEGGYKGNGKSENATAPNGGGTDHGSGKKVSLSGEAKCAKCILHEANTCQTVIQTKDHGKVTTYDVARGFRADVCTAAQMVNATGVVKDVAGKHQLTLVKISAKEK